MARKGNQQKNADRHSSNQKKGVLDSGPALPNTKGRGKISEMNVVGGPELSNGNRLNIPLRDGVNNADRVGDEKKSKQKSGKLLRREKQGVDVTLGLEQPVPCGGNSSDCSENISEMEASGSIEENGTSHGPKIPSSSGRSNEFHAPDNVDRVDSSDPVVGRCLKTLALSMFKTSAEWLERQKPLFIILTTNVLTARDYVRTKIECAYPVVLRWLMHVGNLVLLLAMVWLDCSIRGIYSFLHMGTTSFFSVIWCSIFSIIAMMGMFKFFVILVLATFIGLLTGLTIGILFIAISGIVVLWLYGSFWTTALVVFCGGLAFIFSYQRLALLITTLYSVYCAWTYVGWLGLLFGLNLSFVSSDALIFFLRNNINEHRRPNRPPEFSGEPAHASSSESGSNLPADRSSGIPSTSEYDSEMTSEDEVARLLNCTDHYSALGLTRFENVDVSLLKREYRKKAMLVHPDKNMGNEKAAEAFKKLQNAYEILLDSFKRKAYDDELRREELLNYFRRFENTSQKNRGHGFFSSGFAPTETDAENPLRESRRIACKKCNSFHMWVDTKKLKARARWCQDCKDFHPAKDGDGWVEQSSQPLFFGILQRADAPSAYVCANSKIYDATEWYICQGMSCPVNTHKPSFHVNTSVTAKRNTGKGTSSGQRGGMPTPNMEATMTEEEFFEWLQDAVQAGMFDNLSGSTSESPSAPQGDSSKSGGSSNSSGGSSSKRKKKGKKQW